MHAVRALLLYSIVAPGPVAQYLHGTATTLHSPRKRGFIYTFFFQPFILKGSSFSVALWPNHISKLLYTMLRELSWYWLLSSPDRE